MNFFSRALASFFVLCLLTPACVPLAAQPPQQVQQATPATALQAVARIHGPWSFQVGDDPRWADPAFDDSSWRTVDLDQSLLDQGVDAYSGYAWYRIRLQPAQLAQVLSGSAAGAPQVLMVTGNSVGQLAAYINGSVVNRTRGMTDEPTLFRSAPFTAQLDTGASSGPIVLAIRTWVGPDVPIHRGLLDKVEVGSPADIDARLRQARNAQWNDNAVAPIFVTFLFLSVAAFGFTLYVAQRHHSEYLWLALLCLSVAAGGIAEAAFGLSFLSLAAYRILTAFTGRIFMAVALEFALRFTASTWRKTVRGVQIAVLILPFLFLLHIPAVDEPLSVAADVVFCAVVCSILFHAWRRGRADAGIMLIPFFLAAIADSLDTVLDFLAARHIVPESFAAPRFHFGPVQFASGAVDYAVFLIAIMSVILVRFIRVSQDEQRSNAEIAAARSVQALLIPTQLPSNKYFMLESAYLPVHGVGGDFFQVLPLKDESLLIVVGDVSGKGLQAAMNSSTLVGALRNELSHDPATILTHLNRVLLGAVSSPGQIPEIDAAPSFATCLCARVHPDGTLAIANAGHLSPYCDGRELDIPPSLPLGVIAGVEYEQVVFQLKRGERLVFLSDGVVEATSHEGELFGFDRTRQVSNEPARYIAQTAQRFGQTDDITVVSLYVAASRAGRPLPAQAFETA